MRPYIAGVLIWMFLVAAALGFSYDEAASYVETIETEGREPLSYIRECLDQYDLILFDDALHPAVEPFDFYRRLISDPEAAGRLDYIFLETLHINHQARIDRYLASEPEDLTLLYPVLQNDFSGTGWSMKTYVDLLQTVRRINRQLPDQHRYRVVAVSNPVYWSGIQTPEDLALMRKSLVGRDYLMYKIIVDAMNGFNDGKKGIFLTNTRHAYKKIRRRDGRLYWNTGTFFHQWHPGKTCSIRFHNAQLFFVKERQAGEGGRTTTEGLEQVVYRWQRMAEGIWDYAFAESGNRPVAVSLHNTPFGRDAYVGNHMLNVRAGTTMADAYDAVIFLAPLEQLHFTATVDFLYTESFLKELERRYRILYSEKQLTSRIKERGFSNLRELIRADTAPVPSRRLPMLDQLGPPPTPENQ